MAGRINDEDVAEVRERARIDEIISSYVTLRPAGGGSLQGLCPFHDEKTPSFHVTPSRGFFYCFGCGEGGDVITFVRKIDNLSFFEAVQQLADRVGVVLRISDDGFPAVDPGLRTRIMQANDAAAEFFAAQLLSPDAIAARQMLDQRGFDRAAAEQFGVGYAPRSGRDLHRHLNQKGFDDAVLVKAGLIREQGGWDFFQGRVLWPIRDSAAGVLGFGARRLYDDDRMPAKYINTPETIVYKKSQVLYGLDLARQNVAKKSQAVVVEGYTDVMAAHLSGVDTAVATCGTAFGEGHARILQRLLGNRDVFNGEIIFTFDGDAAGQKAALRVFEFDQDFIAQTYVAVDPEGRDPCDLWMQAGDAAVRDLVGRRVPLYRFVMASRIKEFDLDRAEGRIAALRAVAPLASSVRDRSLVGAYVRELAQMIGMDVDEVRQEVQRSARGSGPSRPRERTPQSEQRPDDHLPQPPASSLPWPNANDLSLSVERDTLKLMLQAPTLFDTAWNGVSVNDFSHPAYQVVFAAITSVPWTPEQWTNRVREATADPLAQQLEIALLVEPILRSDPDEAYASAYTAQLKLTSLTREMKELRSKLQRTNPLTDEAAHKRMFVELLEMENRRRQLQAEAQTNA